MRLFIVDPDGMLEKALAGGVWMLHRERFPVVEGRGGDGHRNGGGVYCMRVKLYLLFCVSDACFGMR